MGHSADTQGSRNYCVLEDQLRQQETRFRNINGLGRKAWEAFS